MAKNNKISTKQISTSFKGSNIPKVATAKSQQPRSHSDTGHAPAASRRAAPCPAQLASGPVSHVQAWSQRANTAASSLPDPISIGRGRALNPTAPPYYPPYSSIANQDMMTPGDTSYQRQPTTFAIELYDALQYPPTRELFQHMIEDATNPHIHNLTSQVTELKTEMRDIRRELEELKQYGRRNALRIFNPRWPEVRDEDTDSLILDLANNILKIKLDPSEISRSHRIGRPSAGNTRPVLVKFTTYRARERIWRSRENGAPHNISINEDLTQATAYLAFRAREAKRSGILIDTRTNDGKVFFRAPLEDRSTVVTDVDDLEVYLDEQFTRQQQRAAERSSLGSRFQRAGQQSRNRHDATQPPQAQGHQIPRTTGMTVTNPVTPLLSAMPGTPSYATTVPQVQHRQVPGATGTVTPHLVEQLPITMFNMAIGGAKPKQPPMIPPTYPATLSAPSQRGQNHLTASREPLQPQQRPDAASITEPAPAPGQTVLQLAQSTPHGSPEEQGPHSQSDKIPAPHPDQTMPQSMGTNSNDMAHPPPSNSSSSPAPAAISVTESRASSSSRVSSTESNPDLQPKQNEAIGDSNEGGEMNDELSTND